MPFGQKWATFTDILKNTIWSISATAETCNFMSRSAYGKFDVQTGQLSAYSQVTVRRREMTGYVKPLYSNVKVYGLAKDKNKPVFHQAYELAVGAAAKVIKNSSTQKVATEVNLSGKLNNPDVSTWEAVLQFVQNGFVEAILPGFDRQTRQLAPG